METTKVNSKALGELQIIFMDWGGSSLEALNQEEALESIERARIRLENEINLQADRLNEMAKKAFPEPPKNYQIEIDED